MALFFNFGETVATYNYKVINERDARASAGIMFLVGLLSLFSVFLERTLFWAELFSITFIVEFLVRVVFNPKYAPYMLLGSIIVYNQKPDWVAAKPKQFAWALGMVLGLIMTFFIVFDVISPIRIAICWLCLFLMFVESVFGICLGCMVYHRLNIKTQNCPGGVCETTAKRKFEKQKIIFILAFSVLFILIYFVLLWAKYDVSQEIIIIND